jgi:hypothetical protein
VRLLDRPQSTRRAKGPPTHTSVRSSTSFQPREASLQDAGRNGSGSLGRRRGYVVTGLHPRHVNPEVDAIPQRPRNAPCVSLDDDRLAPTTAVPLPSVSARARVHT